MSKMQKNTRIINLIVCFGTAILIILLDQITKAVVVNNIELGQSVEIIKGVFRFTFITNSGSAFGMLANARWVFMILSTIGIAAICAYAAMFSAELSRLSLVAFGMVAGGGIGNMIDRTFNGPSLFNGVVVDFIDFCAFPNLWKWTFNVADSFVCIGVALIIFSIIYEEIKKNKNRGGNDKKDNEKKDNDEQNNRAEEKADI